VTQQLFSLAGRKALVTGASRGIGQAIAVAFAEAGADVALTARGAEGLAATAKQLRNFGREAFEIPADLTSQQAATAVVTEAIGKRRLGGWPGRRAIPRPLRRRQGRRGLADQDSRQRVGPGRRASERALPRLDRDRPQPQPGVSGAGADHDHGSPGPYMNPVDP
jgi:NAD(P)-dependent dehydrogenase (short-subunit alcohol dehydrogenase family)